MTPLLVWPKNKKGFQKEITYKGFLRLANLLVKIKIIYLHISKTYYCEVNTDSF